MKKTSLRVIYTVIVVILLNKLSSSIVNPIIGIFVNIGICVFVISGIIKTHKKLKLEKNEGREETKSVNYILLYISITLGVIGGVLSIYYVF